MFTLGLEEVEMKMELELKGLSMVAGEVGRGGARALAYLPYSSFVFAYCNSLPNYNEIKLTFRIKNFENQKFYIRKAQQT